MRSIMLRHALMLLVFALSAQAVAGDNATLEFYGFSRNGQYLAFEQHGVQDGSGFPYSQVFVVSVARNAINASSLQLLQTEADTSNPARIRAASNIRRALGRYGIVRGNLGALVARPTSETRRVQFSRGRTYTLELRETERPATTCISSTAKLLEVTLSRPGLPLVLQRDTRLPASRSCAQGYAIHAVYRYNSSLAVFVRVTRDGFEGPDVRWMVVTGVLR